MERAFLNPEIDGILEALERNNKTAEYLQISLKKSTLSLKIIKTFSIWCFRFVA
jgi:hypothetical protein